MGALAKDEFRTLLQEVLTAYESLEVQLAGCQARVQASEGKSEIYLHRTHGMELNPPAASLARPPSSSPPCMLVEMEMEVQPPDPHSTGSQEESNLESVGSKSTVVTAGSRQIGQTVPALRSEKRTFSQVAPLMTPELSTVSYVEQISHSSSRKQGTALQDAEGLKKHVGRLSYQTAQETSGAISSIVSKMAPAQIGDDGFIARIAKHKYFETFTLAAVMANGIWIAIDADYNDALFILDAGPIFQVMEHLFCTIFTSELLVRMLAFRSRWAALRDPWFVFDAILVFLMVLETWVMLFVNLATGKGNIGVNASILRLLRLARLLRISRIVRAVPELSFIVRGVLEATRGVACTMFLLFGVLYVFGIALKQISADTEMGKKHFKTVPDAMLTLFSQGTLLDDITDLLLEVKEESFLCFALVLVVVDLTALTLMNMLFGILCDVMINVAQKEKDLMALTDLKDKILQAMEAIDTDGDMLISKEEFVHIICNQKASAALQAIGVDVVGLIDHADYFFQSDQHGEEFEEKWTFDHFIEEIMRARGLNAATVRDIFDLRKLTHSQNTNANAMMRQIQEHVALLARNQTKLERLLLKIKDPQHQVSYPIAVS